MQPSDLDIYKSLTSDEKAKIDAFLRGASRNLVHQAREERSGVLPDVIYHYTDGIGLLGILSEAQIRGTHIAYLNDQSELLHLLETFVYIAQERRSSIPDNGFGEFLDGVGVAIDHPINDIAQSVRTWVSCFCDSRDLLSQWRGYSGGHAGYAIGFDFQNLQRALDSNGLAILPCVYDRSFQTEMLAELLSLTEELYLGAEHRFGKEQELAEFRDDLLRSIFNGIIWTGALLKNEAFKEEREWRIHTHGLDTGTAKLNVQFSVQATNISQYVNLPLCQRETKNMPIREILVGPSRNQNLSCAALRTKLAQLGYKNTQVLASTVPLRAF